MLITDCPSGIKQVLHSEEHKLENDKESEGTRRQDGGDRQNSKRKQGCNLAADVVQEVLLVLKGHITG